MMGMGSLEDGVTIYSVGMVGMGGYNHLNYLTIKPVEYSLG